MKAYLLVNAALYLGFAAWCTFSANGTAAGLGYTTRDNSGRSEYLVIYGGLQTGLAFYFWWTTRNPATMTSGLMLALALYIPIVLYRLVTVIRWWPVGGITLATAALELLLLGWAAALAYRHGLAPTL